MEIADIINAIQSNRIRISDHADEAAESDKLTFDEVYFSVLHGEIIEDYPDDKPYQVVWFMVRLSAAIPFTLFGLLMMRINGLFLSLYIVRTPNAGIIFERGDKDHDAVRKMSDLRR